MSLAWQSDALCAETDLEAFFPEKGGSVLEAKRICGSCGVREKCLAYALSMDENPPGIWGGLNMRQRRELREKPVRTEPKPQRAPKTLRRDWTDAEDAVLREMVDLPNTVIGDTLKRAVSSIRARRRALGLRPSEHRGRAA